jgi:hypothetical protein
MQKIIITLVAATFAAAIPAAASSENCGDAAQSQWLSIADITTKATGMGYKVRQVKVEDGCYEIYAVDKNGNRVEAHFNPVTAEVVKTETDD